MNQLLRLITISIFFCVSNAFGSHAPNPSELESKGIAAMVAGDFTQAELDFRELIKITPSSFVGYYNLASALSMQGDSDGSVDAMSNAITLGFSDINQIRRDPDLVVLRDSVFFADLDSNWQALLEARRESDLKVVQPLIRKSREVRTLESLKIELLSAHDEIATDQAIEEIQLLATWANTNLFSEIQTTESIEDSPWIMVVLPDRAGFAQWAITVFGPSVRSNIGSVGGAYEHQKRRLVAQDLGATLRHEFIHVLHWRDMNRLGQSHAPWIQEGLASLVEDYDLSGDDVVPVASWRTNIVKRMSDVHRMPKIEKLASIEMNAFTAKRPLAQYAQARTIMLYLLDEQKLGEFYSIYTQGYDVDPIGISALEQTLGKEIDEIEMDFRLWVDALDRVPETGSDLSATLGIEIENGNGDGVVVKALPGNARTRTGLRLGSVITAINGQPTRDLFELIRILGKYKPGQIVTLHHRRGKVHTTTKAKLLKS
ncbi:MAG: PDZ domain-containing protein [Phycisphaerales bacterium]|nr:PDZ domain-containing protein [Phycisphaerales bacterium]